ARRNGLERIALHNFWVTQHWLFSSTPLPDHPGLLRGHVPERHLHRRMVDESARPCLFINPIPELVIKEVLILRSELDHGAHQRISIPRAPGTLGTSLSHIETDSHTAAIWLTFPRDRIGYDAAMENGANPHSQEEIAQRGRG